MSLQVTPTAGSSFSITQLGTYGKQSGTDYVEWTDFWALLHSDNFDAFGIEYVMDVPPGETYTQSNMGYYRCPLTLVTHAQFNQMNDSTNSFSIIGPALGEANYWKLQKYKNSSHPDWFLTVTKTGTGTPYVVVYGVKF